MSYVSNGDNRGRCLPPSKNAVSTAQQEARSGNFSGVLMASTVPDRADFAIFPPVIPYSTLIVACLLQWLEPLGLLVHLERMMRIAAGAPVFAAGMAMMAA